MPFAVEHITHLFIRHGKGAHNAYYEQHACLPTDMEDPCLVEEGYEQARQLGPTLSALLPPGYPVHLIVSSPTTRTVRTAIEALKDTGLPHNILLSELAAERRLDIQNLNVGLSRAAAIDLSWQLITRKLDAGHLHEPPLWWEGPPENDDQLKTRGMELTRRTHTAQSLAIIFSHAHLIKAVTGIEPGPGRVVAYSHQTKKAALQL